MDKIMALLKKLGIELTADQTKQVEEVLDKEFVTATDAAKIATELEDIKKQLSDRDADLAKLKNDTASVDLKKQLDDLTVKYKNDTDALNAKLEQQKHDHAAERFFGGYKFASDRVKNSVLEDFKKQGFKLQDDGTFAGGSEFMEKLQKTEPDVFAKEDKPGLFMGGTQSNVPADSNNLESQIMSGFGLIK